MRAAEAWTHTHPHLSSSLGEKPRTLPSVPQTRKPSFPSRIILVEFHRESLSSLSTTYTVSDFASVPEKEAALRLNLEVPTGSVWSMKLVEAGPGPKDRFLPDTTHAGHWSTQQPKATTKS